MDKSELKDFLDDLERCMDNDFRREFEESSLYPFFKKLMLIVFWNEDGFDDDIVRRLDILSDNIDSFDFTLAKKNIDDLRKIL